MRTSIPKLIASAALAAAAGAWAQSTPAPIEVGRVVEGQLGSGQPQHSISLRAGQTVRITARGRGFDALLRLYAPTGSEALVEDDDSGGGTVAELVFTAEQAGTYRLEVVESGTGSAAHGTRAYDLTVSAAPTPAFAAAVAITPNGDRPIAVDMAKCGNGCRYTFAANAGERLVAETSDDDAEADPVLELRLGSEKLAEDDDSGEGVNARLVRRIERTGTYTLLARTLHGAGTYKLRVSLRPHVVRAAQALAIGTPVSGTLNEAAEIGDDGHFYDAYTLHGRAGQRVAVEMASDAFDTVIEVDGDSVLGRTKLAGNDDARTGTTNSRVVLSFARDGDVDIRAAALSGEGAYTLRVINQPTQ